MANERTGAKRKHQKEIWSKNSKVCIDFVLNKRKSITCSQCYTKRMEGISYLLVSMIYILVNIFINHVETISCLPGLNQYSAVDKVSSIRLWVVRERRLWFVHVFSGFFKYDMTINMYT